MKAGMDCGTTLTKVAWYSGPDRCVWHTLSTADHPMEDILEEMRRAGVTTVRVTGVGAPPVAEDMTFVRSGGDPIADEILLQSVGASLLLSVNGPKKFLLASLGTGASYTLVGDGEPRHFPFGNAIAGGFVDGLAAALSRVDLPLAVAYAAAERPLDTLVRDVVPAMAGSLAGEFVVAHFGKVRGTDMVRPGQMLASALHCVAVSVIRDAMMIGMIEGYATDDIVFVGSTVSRFAPVRAYLEKYADALGKRAWFPKDGEYVGALGALRSD